MKCPGCGREMAPGSLFCENCGYEIHIVPDYDPLEELTVGDDPLIEGGGAEHGATGMHTGRTGESAGRENEGGFGTQRLEIRPKKHGRRKKCAAAVLVCVAVAAAVSVLTVSSIRGGRKDDYTRYLDEGLALYEEEDYEGAAESLAKALALQGGSGGEGLEILESLAYAYAYVGEDAAAVDCIKEALENVGSPEDDIDAVYELYKKYMDILNITGQTGEVNDIIDSCGDEELALLLYDYRISVPTVSEPEGTYTYYLRLELEAEYGTIYYTLDGTAPSSLSTRYDGAFTLMDEGENFLRAVAVNKKDMVSEELNVYYILEFAGGDGDGDNVYY